MEGVRHPHKAGHLYGFSVNPGNNECDMDVPDLQLVRRIHSNAADTCNASTSKADHMQEHSKLTPMLKVKGPVSCEPPRTELRNNG